MRTAELENEPIEDDDDIVIDIDFPTPQTPEEARKEIEEIEEKIRQRKCMSHEDFIAYTHQKLNNYLHLKPLEYETLSKEIEKKMLLKKTTPF